MLNGLINYVEPNWVNTDEKQDTTHQLPLEDLAINVNLSVEVPVEQREGIVQQENKKFVVTFMSDGERTYTNLMQGSKVMSNQTQTFLTTNYTEATYEDIKKGGTNEMFGISSIDVQYNDYYTPQVTIQFVDIRGTALFAPEEQKHPGADGYVDENIAGSFFRCFFVTPYPKFTLMIKGFYGQPVTYELTCSDFRAKFDSKTGNFNATAKLVGYTFSILGDISLNTLITSPCSPYLGAEYWDKQVNAQRFYIGNKPMKKLHELLNEWTDISKVVREKLAQTQEAKDLKNSADKKSEYEAVRNKFCELVNVLKNKCPHKNNGYKVLNVTCNTTSGQDSGTTISCNCSVLYENRNDFLWLGNSYEGTEEVLEIYDTFIQEFNRLELDEKKKPRVQYEPTELIYFEEDGTRPIWKTNITNEIRTLWRKEWLNRGISVKTIKDNSYGCYIFDQGFLNYIDSLIKGCTDNAESLQNNLDKKREELILEGFDIMPTIYNIIKTIMAHLETFMYMMYTCHTKVLESKRTIGSVGISMENYSSDEPLCPFPDVIEVEDDKNGGTNNIQKWIGDVAQNIDQVEEINLINGLLEGIKDVAKATEEYEEKMEEEESTSTDNPITLTPLTVHDIYYSKIWGNVDVSNQKSISAAIILRAMGVLGLIDEWGQDVAEEMGTHDAQRWKSQFADIGTSIKTMLHNGTYTSDTILADCKNYSYENKNLIKENTTGYNKWEMGLGNELIPIQQIDTTTNSKMLEEMCLGDTQNEEKYCRRDPNKVSQNPNAFKIDKDIKKFVEIGQSHPIEGLRNKIGIKDFKGSYEKWIKVGDGNCPIMAKKFKNNDVQVYGVFASGSGLFGKTKSSTATLDGKSIFSGEYGMWCDKNWTFGKLMCKVNGDTETIERPKGTIEDCFVDAEYESRIDEYTIPMFRGVDIDEDLNIKAIPGESLFAQPIYYKWGGGVENAHYRQAYLFLKTFENSHNDGLLDVECGGFIYENSILEELMDEYWDSNKQAVYMLPYIVVLYLGASFYLGSDEGKSLRKWNDKEDLKVNIDIDYNLCPQTKDIFIKEFKNWADGTFREKIHKKYALNIKNGSSLDNVINFVTEDDLLTNTQELLIGDKNHNAEDNLDKIPQKFTEWFDDTFFEQYISFVTGNHRFASNESCKGFRLCNRNTTNLSNIMKELYSPCVMVLGNEFIKVNDSGKQEYPQLIVTTDWMEGYLNGFISELKNQYEQPVSDNSTRLPKVESETPNDIKHSLYRYLKAVYDKWLCGNLYESKNGNLWDHWSLENFFEPHFHFIDTYYNYSAQILINLDDFLARMVQSTTQSEYTLIQFISQICMVNNIQIQCIQNFLDYNNQEMMKDMFKPIPSIESKIPEPEEIYCDFVFIKQNEPSKQLEMKGVDGKDKNDGFMIYEGVSEHELPVPIASKTNMTRPSWMGNGSWLSKFNDPGHYRHKIPCFGVAYGYQYQSYFTDIQIGMDNPIATEASIKAEMNIIMASHKKGDGTEQEEKSDNTKVSVGKQDLYSVYMNNSYSCEVTMLGCPWVQPLMYFTLLNVPMFRGCFLIHKVSHSIKPGDMKTKFTGTRISKYSSPDASNVNIISNDTINYASQESASIERQAKIANSDNDCEYKKFYPQYEKVSSTSTIDIEELKNTKVQDFSTKDGWNEWFYNLYKDCTVWDALVSGLYGEYGYGTDLDQQLIATVLYNRIMKGNGVHNTGLSKNVCTFMQINGLKLDKQNINDRKSYNNGKRWEKCSRNLEYIFTNSPSVLVGQEVVPDKPTLIYKDGISTGQKTQSKTLTLDDLQRVYFYLATSWYSVPKESGSGHRKYDYLFHHNGHLFTHKNDKLWDVTAPKPKENETTISHLDKLNDIVKCIEETCLNSPDLGIKTVVKHTIDGDSNNLIISPLDELKSDKLNSKLYDVVLNTYSSYLTHIHWLAKDSNSSKDECCGVLIGIADKDDGKKSIGIYYSNDGNINTTKGYTAVVDSVTNEGGILNKQFYTTLGKYYGEVTDSNINEFHDVKNYTNNNLYDKENHMVLINGLLQLNKATNCGGYEVFNTPFPSISNKPCGDKPKNTKQFGDTIQISRRFTLADFTNTHTRNKSGIDNLPTVEHFDNLKKLAAYVEKLMDDFEDEQNTKGNKVRYYLHSVYRCPRVNDLVGGMENSQHMIGQAMDLDVLINGEQKNAEFFKFVKNADKSKYGDFGQLIWEGGNYTEPDWLHISIPRHEQGGKRNDIRYIKVSGNKPSNL